MHDKSQHEKQKLKPIESVGVGAVTGVVSASVYLPFWTIKMRHQCELPFTLHPRVLYKGYGTILGVIAPITILQIFNASRVESITASTTVSPEQRMLSSFMGGASSAVVSNLLNLVGTQQHKHSHPSPRIAAHTLYSQFGPRKLFVGLPTTAMGEGLFTMSYYGMVPYLKPYMKEYFDNEVAATLAAGVLAGIPTAVITQPLDRIKTMQHKHADEVGAQGKNNGLIKCCKELYKTSGFRVGFFKGLIPRGIGLTATITAAGATADFVENAYKGYKS